VAAPTTDLPQDPPTGDERTTLEAFLEYYRAVTIRKAEGITDTDARRALCPPSELTIIGIVRHLTEVERSWFRRDIAAEAVPPLYYGESHPTGDRDGDFHAPPDATIAAALDSYRDEVDRCRAVMATVDSLDQLEANADVHSERRNVRWILVHMVEEYSRHAGHLDLLREAADGTVGD
jgi:uncharacterized damage-inducible protein DinB